MQKVLARSEALNAEQIRATRNAFETDHRYKAVETLNHILADTVAVALGCRQAHWNIRGRNFESLHLLFGDAYEQLDNNADELAERISALGGIVKGTVHQTAERSTLEPFPALAISEREHIVAISERLGEYSGALRDAIRRCDQLDDPVTVHHLTEAAACAEKLLWRVESHAWKE